ncbi:MAG: ABC-F family ATP-binding cassette domain-containing protein [Lachnospiraceae bacterium]|nr:ABC-F family ATP-binding cassette domain-containing protein [Lachnospiraceae bacterium]
MSQIQVQNLSFSYEGSSEFVFENVSFWLDTSWRLGLIGRNGKGKTTFLRLLMGELEDGGSIRPRPGCKYFPYQVEQPKRLTMEVLEECEPGYELWKVCRELNLMEMDTELLGRPFDTLSGGEQTRVLLALLFSGEEKDFLLIDEPTNHLDLEARRQVGEYLGQKSGFILVSHDRHFLDGCVDHILAIERQQLTVQKGNYTVWQQEKERRDQAAVQKNEQLKREIGRLKETERQKEGWSQALERTKTGTRIGGLRPDRGHIGHKAAKMMKRAKVLERRMEQQVQEKQGLLENVENPESLKLFPLCHHRQELLRLQEVVLSYGERAVCGPLRMAVGNGERVALCGPNGCGKSTVLKQVLAVAGMTEGLKGWEQIWEGREEGQENSLAGIVESFEGAEQMQKGVKGAVSCRGVWDQAFGLKISYVPQDVSFLRGSLEEFAREQEISWTLFLALLRKLDFSREQFGKPMEQYSQGQKKKVLLAKSLCEQAHLYIWDEPLNYVDLFSREQIAELIVRHRPAMLLVEHDVSFLEEIGARCIWMGEKEDKVKSAQKKA